MHRTSRIAIAGFVVVLGGAAAAVADPVDEDLSSLDTAAQKAPPGGSGLDTVLGSLHLRACVRSDVAPFGSFMQSRLLGFDIDLASEIATQISIDYKQALRVEWVVVDADDRIKHVVDGSCDIVVADLSYTKERAAQIGTSKVYLRTDKVLVAAAKITRKVPVIARLAGATAEAADVKGSTREFRTYQDIIRAMDAGEVDYIVTDRPIAAHLVRSSIVAYEIKKVLAENAESYVIGVSKSHPELLEAVNRALETLAHDGRLALLSRRWL
jgi:ABC-type amino acid transport substrate-binding protein